MIAEVATDLLGEIVEIYEWDDSPDYRLCGRGHVRAVYVADKGLVIVVAHDVGHEATAYNHRTKNGGLASYALHQFSVRVVQRCQRCGSWDQKSMLKWSQVFHDASARVAAYPGEGADKTWEHRPGEGCKKVGHGG